MNAKMERLQAQLEDYQKKAKATKEQLETLRRAQHRKARIEAKKAHTRALFEAGNLVHLAGLLALDPATLLGALLELAAQAADGHHHNRWKQRGEAALAQHKKAQKRPPAD